MLYRLFLGCHAMKPACYWTNREFENSLVKMNIYDQFSLFNLGYDANNKVEFITVHSLNDIALKLNNRIVSDMSGLELFSFIIRPYCSARNGRRWFCKQFIGVCRLL